jgi:hypothetical protein
VALPKFADMMKLDVSDEVLNEVIEAMVQLLNTEAGKFALPAEAQGEDVFMVGLA